MVYWPRVAGHLALVSGDRVFVDLRYDQLSGRASGGKVVSGIHMGPTIIAASL